MLLHLQDARLRAASSLVEDLKTAQEGHEATERPQQNRDFTTASKAEAGLQNCSDLTVSLVSFPMFMQSSHICTAIL